MTRSSRSRSSTATLLLTNASGLLISWATPGDELAQAGELLGLDHPALGGLECLVAWRSERRSSWRVTFCSLSISSARIRSVTSQKMPWMPMGSRRGRTGGSSSTWT